MTQGPRRAPDPIPVFLRTGTPDGMGMLDDVLVDRYIAALVHSKHKPASTEANRLKPEDVRFLAYAFIVERSRRGKVLTEAHLRLLAAALGIERRSKRAMEEMRLPGVSKVEAFLEAADIQAREPDISANRLASCVGVGNRTIRRWRELPAFAQRVRAVRVLEGKPDVEDRTIAEGWQAAIMKTLKDG